MPFFKLLHKDSETKARVGEITTDHGVIKTPTFMPVGTQAAVKTLDSADIEEIKAQIILGNNYHLHLRPGENLIADIGGLHKFMNWKKPILTDSGGFQVFSLGLQKEKKKTFAAAKTAAAAKLNVQTKYDSAELKNDPLTGGSLVKITEEGVAFQSHLDGSAHIFTPESAIECEHKLGADIIMAFDECTPDDADLAYAREAMERTHRWAERSLQAHRKNTRYHGYNQFLFGIIQGANREDLRRESARYIDSLGFDGIAIGGESIGYNMEATANILDWVYPLIDENKPHYAMGVGLNPTDLLIAVEYGADMFDCVAPTRLARHGMLFTFDKTNNHRLNIKNAKFAKDFSPADNWCDCSTCKNYSRAYLHHLFDADEMTALRLASIHNLRFMLKLMEETRGSILDNRFNELKATWI
ncbi:MAG: tRNA guanosine(34) transglycosylase Tgt [Candidatus Magasanikbacteria bacterium RIFCSPLOWO2_02_FULL_44_11]|uniref:Queuine tRNA-ribosyltransferase n=1 Tax=Candidatus Magasanikbacteria bacterium RIFCSPLOWO2_02_FULL_44_11 TaxID=1798689 RepID=A0A1F6NBT4_9BACT|nr:MAG: tRNA guanosine(34) transglycosylase Tgt [Candidatus Magasanikbacteria bacterium RIFCSPLOWO2_02_FULL_44_11]